MGQLADSIAQGIKDAMRAKDRDRLAALRDIKSKLMLEATKDGASDDVDDATTLAILSKLLKVIDTLISFWVKCKFINSCQSNNIKLIFSIWLVSILKLQIVVSRQKRQLQCFE